MKKVTRLLILTAFVLPILTLSRVYAGAPPHFGQPGFLFQQRERSDLHPGVTGSPYRFEDPFGGNARDFNRDDLLGRDPFQGRDVLPLDRHFGWNGVAPDNGGAGDPLTNGGATAPLDGGISLLLAAGIGLGFKKARERKRAIDQKNIENAE